MKIIVLGAGILGVTSAWFLRRDGHDVTVIDRQPAAGLETSYANGSQISVSYAEPWANPGAPLKILKWLGKRRFAIAVQAQCRSAPVDVGSRRSSPTARRAARGFNTIQLTNLGIYSRNTLIAPARGNRHPATTNVDEAASCISTRATPSSRRRVPVSN